jgi:BirA family biotin operon repressor/biotin-[acetyl-CoA-carboxylase] ligase
LGVPRVHLRETDSTNVRASALAGRGAPHGTLVTAAAQTSGRGRQGRTWMAPAGRALLCSILLRDPPRLLPLAAGAAVAEVASNATGRDARVKWPNDVWLEGLKVAGILVEGRPQEHWAVLGIGLNVALRESDFPDELKGLAGTLGLSPSDIEPMLSALLSALERWLGTTESAVLDEVRRRDALNGRAVSWAGGRLTGTGSGIDGDGRLIVITEAGERLALDAGEVHLART